ncbi:MAG: hypothetical protein CMJ48_07775 [Planctomycetaceae bacterium]|nr:hypothetical protein [Planctomycetaceae bacterium]
MNEERPETLPQDPRVRAALQEYLERLDGGEQVDSEAFLEQHADVADEVRSFITTEEELRKLVRAEGDEQPAADESRGSTQSLAMRNQETILPQREPVSPTKAGNQPALPGEFGRYRILKPLGRGAMGVVYLAEDTQLERQVALKTPTFENDETGELLERFYREAKSAATLQHPNICPVFDVGEIDACHYISMAYVEGRPLSAYIRPDQPQPERQILRLVRKLALALSEAHAKGIVHRDLKPSNIMVDARGEPIVMDFGLASDITREDASRLTQSGTILGSPAYMSPEQVEGVPENITPATDQHSLGVILFELLTSQLPFRGSVTAVIAHILTQEPPTPREFRPDVDPRIEAVCLKMMAKSAAERFPSLKAAADALTAILKQGVSTKTAPADAPSDSAADRSSPASGKKRTTQKVASAAQESVPQASFSKSNIATLLQAARKCIAKHDYEQVIQMLDPIPDDSRTDAVYVLLECAQELADEVAYLLVELDEAVRMRDDKAALEKADELLKIQPGHHRATQAKQQLTALGLSRWWPARGKRRSAGKYHGTWGLFPKSQLLAVAAIVAFATMCAVVTFVWKTESGTVEITVDESLMNEDISFALDGESFRIENFGESIKVMPGEQTLIVQRDGLEAATKQFTLKKNGKIALWVTLIDGKVDVIDEALPAVKDLAPLSDSPAGNWVDLFDGKSLDGWTTVGPSNGWSVANPHTDEARIAYDGTGGPGWLSTNQQFADFALRFEYKLQAPGNSGVFLRADRAGVLTGKGKLEIQLLDDAAPDHAQLPSHRLNGALWSLAPVSKKVPSPAGQWHTMEIRAEGSQIRVTVNGTVVMQDKLDFYQQRAGEFPDLNRKSGYIGLQRHKSRVEFRKIRIRELGKAGE